MRNHHRNVELPNFPRPYPVRRPSSHVASERRQPLLWLVLLLQGLTLLLLVVGAFPIPRTGSALHPALTTLVLPSEQLGGSTVLGGGEP